MQRLSTPRDRELRQKVYGVVIGIVTNNNDPEGKYRVKVRYPWLADGDQTGGEESHWARVASMMTGAERGSFWLPEVDDEVLISFVQGDMQQPVVVGSLWNGVDKSPYGNHGGKGIGQTQVRDAKGKLAVASGPTLEGEFCGPVEAKKNDLRFFRSRRRHALVFNDNAQGSRVVLHSEQRHRIVLDDSDNKPTRIEIVDGAEENYIIIDTVNKKITIESKTGSILLKAKEAIRIEADRIETASFSATEMKVGKNFVVQASSNVTIDAGGASNLTASQALSIKGAKVNINSGGGGDKISYSAAQTTAASAAPAQKSLGTMAKEAAAQLVTVQNAQKAITAALAVAHLPTGPAAAVKAAETMASSSKTLEASAGNLSKAAGELLGIKPPTPTPAGLQKVATVNDSAAGHNNVIANSSLPPNIKADAQAISQKAGQLEATARQASAAATQVKTMVTTVQTLSKGMGSLSTAQSSLAGAISASPANASPQLTQAAAQADQMNQNIQQQQQQIAHLQSTVATAAAAPAKISQDAGALTSLVSSHQMSLQTLKAGPAALSGAKKLGSDLGGLGNIF